MNYRLIIDNLIELLYHIGVKLKTNRHKFKIDSVAQLVEQQPFKLMVAGSIPARVTKK